MNNNHKMSSSVVSSTTTDLIDAKLEEHQLCGSNKQCPGCGHKFEAKPDWVGLPAGVKFDPTDQELIEHLEAKVEARNMKSHPLIDEFIPTIEGEDGICYTHPEKLPGVTRDGLSRHFFHRPSKAYTTGTRKRRKIQNECDLQGGETRWHKTGKTRPVMVNGKQKGCKKILVLYTNFGKNRKPEKTNWVMHQYHLGQNEEEKEGELVVSKIFYQTQPRQCNWSDRMSASTTTTGEPSGEPPNNNNASTHNIHNHNHSHNPNPSPNPNGASSSRRGDSGGSGSCSSSKDNNNNIVAHHRDHEMMSGAVGVVPPMPTFAHALDLHHHHFKSSDHFSFIPFRKTFDEVGIGEGSTGREVQASGSCEEIHEGHHRPQHHHHIAHHQNPQQQHHQIATSAFHISRPSHPISAIISPPPLHHTSIILDESSYQVSRILLQNDHFHQQHQEQQQQQHHHKLGASSASGLEEIIMGCTSSSDIKEESSINNPQEAEWLKYSSYWPDPDNPDHHHHHG